jgi:N-acetylmuramic acid 6-phosphate etherase
MASDDPTFVLPSAVTHPPSTTLPPIIVRAAVATANDPFHISQQIALKLLLNAHSTAVMTRLGKVIGNTMTNVSPSNLKLIGRATNLIHSHVQSVLRHASFAAHCSAAHAAPAFTSISYAAVNAVLFEAIHFLRAHHNAGAGASAAHSSGQTAEVAVSIIAVLEAARTHQPLRWEHALQLLHTTGLRLYLKQLTSSPASTAASAAAAAAAAVKK